MIIFKTKSPEKYAENDLTFAIDEKLNVLQVSSFRFDTFHNVGSKQVHILTKEQTKQLIEYLNNCLKSEEQK